MPYTIEFTGYYHPKERHHTKMFKNRKAADTHLRKLKKKYGDTKNIEGKSRYIGVVHIKPKRTKKTKTKKRKK